MRAGDHHGSLELRNSATEPKKFIDKTEHTVRILLHQPPAEVPSHGAVGAVGYGKVPGS
jgi:hypothetical protein